MNSISGNLNVTIPWGSGAQVPRQYIDTEVTARKMISELTNTAREHLSTPGPVDTYGVDLDEHQLSSSRVMNGYENNYLKVTGQVDGGQVVPKEMLVGKVGSGIYKSASWDDKGAFVEGEREQAVGFERYRETIRVNNNSTLTYIREEMPKGPKIPTADDLPF